MAGRGGMRAEDLARMKQYDYKAVSFWEWARRGVATCGHGGGAPL